MAIEIVDLPMKNDDSPWLCEFAKGLRTDAPVHKSFEPVP